MRITTPLVLTLLLASICTVFAAAPNGGRDGVWSPDGTRIAFVSGLPHGISNIWVMDSDGAKARQLTYKGGHSPKWVPGSHTVCFSTMRTGRDQVMAIDASAEPGSEKPYEVLPAGAMGPEWSPDGKRVAYLVPSKSGRSRDLWVADADGSNGRGISKNFFIRDYAWNPDGKQIVFVVGRAIGSSLWITDIDTKDVQVFYKGYCSAPSYSKDGKYIAFATPSTKGEHKIMFVEVASGVDKRIMVESFDGNVVRWRPDGRGFLFTSKRRADAGLWTVNIDGRNRQRITDVKLAVYDPVYSPDGKRLLFFATASDTYGPDVYTSDASGANPKRLTRTIHSQWAPAWSHNGAKLAAVSDAGNTGKLLVVDPKTGRVNNPGLVNPSVPVKLLWSPNDSKILTLFGSVVAVTPSTASKPSGKQVAAVDGQTDASWSTDSKSVFFTDWKKNCAGTSLAALDGGKPQQITVGSLEAGQERKVEDQNAEIHKKMGIGGPVEEVAAQTVFVSDLYPRLSPDGKLIAFIRKNQVWTVDISGSEQKQMTNLTTSKDSDSKSDVSSLEWSPDGKLLVFQRHLFNEQSGLEFQIWTVEPDSGDARKIYTEKVETEYGVFAPGITYAPVFTPEGKSILFTSTTDGIPAICTIDPDGQNRKVLVKGPAVFPALAPNGTQLAYISLEDCQERLKLLDLASGVIKDVKL